MKKVFSIILPLIALVVTVNAQPSSAVSAKVGWQEFVFEKENFKVMLPSKPVEATETVESEIGRVPIRRFASKSASGSIHVVVMVAEYPLSFDTDEAAKKVIEAGINSMTAKMKLENVEQKDIVFGKYFGREVRAQVLSGLMTMRAFIVKNRMYMLIAVVDKMTLKSPVPSEVKMLFDSFDFIKSPESITTAAAPVSAIGAERDETAVSPFTEPISWRNFRQPEYGFAVRLPREPRKEIIKINPSDSRLDMHNWLAVGENGFVYQVAFQQLLAVPKTEHDAKTYIESLRDGLAEGIGGKIVSERQVSYNGYVGREIKIKSTDMEGLGRLFLIGARVYLLVVLTANGEINQKIANDYFDSLIITVNPDSVSVTAGTVVETAVWKEIAEPKLGFKMMMPADPVREVKDIEDLKIEMFTATGDGIFCLTGHMFLPGPRPSKQELAQFFKNFGGGFATAMKANVVAEKDISFEGHPGRELTLKTNFVTGVCRVYVVDRRAYILITFPTLPNSVSHAMDKFLESFKLTGIKNDSDAPPPPPPPLPKVDAGGKVSQSAPKKINVSGGVLQASGIKKVQPAYPLEAKMASVQGEVQIQILVSEEGKVIEAILISGPVELREAALNAARLWEFKPTELSGVPVKIQGVLTFRFTLQ